MGQETIIRLAQESAARAESTDGQRGADPTVSLEDFATWFEERIGEQKSAAPSIEDTASAAGGDSLGRFRVIRRLGSGGFGIVFLAFDPLLKREIALKLPRPEILMTPGWHERVLREAQIAATLDHPGIVQVYEVGTIGPIWYIASAYCDGLSLAEYLADRPGGIPIGEAIHAVLAVAEAVQHAHTRGILHRDIKSGNVLLAAHCQTPDAGAAILSPRLTDFGLAAQHVEESETIAPRLAGTPGYMAPELSDASGSGPSIQSDIYSLGAMLFELLTGSLPPAIGGATSRVRSLRGEVDADLDAIVAKCLEPNPADRYASAAGLLSDLEANLEGRPVAARPLGNVRTAVRWCWRRPVFAGLATMLLFAMALGVGGVTWQWRRAEAHLRTAEMERERAELHLGQTERALLDLGTAINDSTFFRDLNRVEGNPQVLSAAEHYEALLLDPHGKERSPPLVAIAHGQLARRLEAQGNLKDAKKHYRECLIDWWALVRESPQNEAYRRWLTQACDWYGEFQGGRENISQGRSQVVNGKLLDAIPIEEAVGRNAASDYASMLLTRAEAFSKADAWPSSIHQFEACLDLSRSLYEVHRDADSAVRIARSGFRLSEVLQVWGERHRSVKVFNELWNEVQPLVAAHPADRPLVLSFAEISLRRVNHGQELPVSEKLSLLKQADRSLVALENSSSALTADEIRFAIRLQRAIAELHADEPNPQQRLLAQQQAAVYCDRLRQVAKPKPSDYTVAGNVYRTLAMTLSENAEADRALALFDKAAQAFTNSADGSRKRKANILNHSQCYLHAAAILQARGRLEEAAQRVSQAIVVLEAWGTDQPTDRTIARELDELRTELAELNAFAQQQTQARPKP